ncbi:MAG: hypothetical protein ACFFD4_39705, partial [Candidatus Odinarchaeota archaeon]
DRLKPLKVLLTEIIENNQSEIVKEKAVELITVIEPDSRTKYQEISNKELDSKPIDDNVRTIAYTCDECNQIAVFKLTDDDILQLKNSRGLFKKAIIHDYDPANRRYKRVGVVHIDEHMIIRRHICCEIAENGNEQKASNQGKDIETPGEQTFQNKKILNVQVTPKGKVSKSNTAKETNITNELEKALGEDLVKSVPKTLKSYFPISQPEKQQESSSSLQTPESLSSDFKSAYNMLTEFSDSETKITSTSFKGSTDKFQRIIDFYMKDFTADEIDELVGFQNNEREIAYYDLDGNYHDDLFFMTKSDMIKFFKENTPLSVHIGAKYVSSIENNYARKKEQMNWMKRELVARFTFDLENYHRDCNCKGDMFCEECKWIVKLYAHYLRKHVFAKLGFIKDQIKIIFSYRQEIHVWIKKDDFKAGYSQKKREIFVERKVQPKLSDVKVFKALVYKRVFADYVAGKSKKSKDSLTISEIIDHVKFLLKRSEKMRTNRENQLIRKAELFPPVLDCKSITDPKYKSPFPGSLDGKTLKVVKII